MEKQPLIAFFENITVNDAMLLIHEYAKLDYPLYPLFLTDRQGRLAGMITLNSILAAADVMRLYELKEEECIAVYAHTKEADAEKLFQAASVNFLPVVTEERHLIGVIHQGSC